MGCAISKEVESRGSHLKETSSWEKLIHRRFSIQFNRSLRTMDGSFITAIFSSASYGIFRKHANVKALEKKSFLKNFSQTESYSTHAICPVTALDANAHTNLVEETVLVVPMSIIQSASDFPQASKSIESFKEDLETINIAELMKGLPEEAVSANFENLDVSLTLLLPEAKQESSTSLSRKPTDKVHASEAVSANKTARRQQLNFFLSTSPIESVGNVDMALSETLSPLKSSREVCQHRSMNGYLIEKVKSDKSIHLPNENIGSGILECTGIATTEERLTLNSKNLQRVLSFNYLLAHSSNERQNSPFINVDALGTAIHEAPSTTDSLVFATNQYLTSSPSSPEFPTNTSLNDWLPSMRRPSAPSNSSLFDDDSTVLETLQRLPCLREAAEYCHASSSESLCFERAFDQLPRLQCQDGPEVEDCDIPVFDPEMIDYFENAISHLSKEEWDAVRGMEESPRNFLRLVKALKKSRSSSVRSKKENTVNLKFDTMEPDTSADTDAKKHCEPWKSSDSKIRLPGKTRTFIRQTSLDAGISSK
ncbi:hypothetical protein L7F22_058383 [Adiantum nelumboides]|nr:hypothetical protein [Adiantum nelumboides]